MHNTEQKTLLEWKSLPDEVKDGCFVQICHSCCGPFIFKNPIAKAIKQWGLRDLSKLIYDAHTLYEKYHVTIERECSEEEFMALFEQMPEFDDLDDTFVEKEEEWTSQIATYIDQHIDHFVVVTNE